MKYEKTKIPTNVILRYEGSKAKMWNVTLLKVGFSKKWFIYKQQSFSFFSSFFFQLLKKKSCKAGLDKKELQRARPTLARIFVVPHARHMRGFSSMNYEGRSMKYEL